MNGYEVQNQWIKHQQEQRKRDADRSQQLVDESAAVLADAVERCRKAFPELCQNGEPHHYLVLGAIALRRRNGGTGKATAAAVLEWAKDHHTELVIKRGQGDPSWPALVNPTGTEDTSCQ